MAKRHPTWPPETLGDLIRLRREATGLSQLELSRLLGVDEKTVSKWENNKVTPGPSSRVELRDALGGAASDYTRNGVPDAELPEVTQLYESFRRERQRREQTEDALHRTRSRVQELEEELRRRGG